MSNNSRIPEKVHTAYLHTKKKISTFFKLGWSALIKSYTFLRARRRWVDALILILVGVYVGSWLEANHAFLDIRYKVHQLTQEMGSKIKGDLYDHNTVLVLIDDDDYWKGSFEGRRPLNMSNLADLICKLDEYNPKVIALDFDFRSPMPDGAIVDYERYSEDTRKFAQAVKDTSSRRRVVLPKTIDVDNNGLWITESDKYDGQDLGDAHFGYIELYDDFRILPTSLRLQNGQWLESFSQAIVRSFALTDAPLRFDRRDGSLTYNGPYLYEDQFVQYSVGEVLNPDPSIHQELAHKIGGKIVIVGGVWSRAAYERGDRVDERDTPVGKVPAVFLHANWVESMLQQRTAKPVKKWITLLLEVILGFIGYYVFSLRMRWLLKAAYFIGLVLFWFAVTYVSAQNLGLFFDPITPTLVGFGKAFYEEISEWKQDARKYRETRKKSKKKRSKRRKPKVPKQKITPSEVEKEVANAA